MIVDDAGWWRVANLNDMFEIRTLCSHREDFGHADSVADEERSSRALQALSDIVPDEQARCRAKNDACTDGGCRNPPPRNGQY